ncbi:Surface antigen precursor [Sphingobium herbicidovorans NBRC 16415]|uniref:Surface antigen n=1 Tax=Sphingobium herbicidovorans (strain ATCC 700291 / DSM 11019 / CCUG 56400 / KCTC 2939 / LMG 18315 / NBRC 16415 / MH) TaxID=1219045 RepID=A0A086P9Z5_SPHHM|nr:CHAP domain-containing protein [Sphingobium herbicidovorans]KFG90213.1 Surface antigen precursor [Sphingobium herbicidovorans NBRC 16415]
MFRYVRGAVWLLAGLIATPVSGATALQCVPYARIVSGVNIRGDALTWWDQAQDRYARGHLPRRGAVMAFRPYGPMVLGHVAVVSKVLDDRRVLIRHANWSVPGAIEEDVLAIDVSDAGDWSAVRVWHSPTGQMGARTNPTFGFIYPGKAQLRPFEPDPALGASVRFAKADPAVWEQAGPAAKAVDESEGAERLAGLGRSLRKALREPRLETDMRAIQFADAAPSGRSLRDIIADVKRDARLR